MIRYVRRLVKKPPHRWATRRGLFLETFGLVYIIIGYSLLALSSNPPATRAAVRKSLHVALQVAPLSAYGWLWIASGAVAITAGLLARFEVVGFAVAAFMPMLWAMVYLIDWSTVPRAWLSAAVYVLLAIAMLIVAGMPDTTDLEELHRAIQGPG